MVRTPRRGSVRVRIPSCGRLECQFSNYRFRGLTAGRNVLGGEGKLSGGEMSGRICPRLAERYLNWSSQF